MTRLTRLGSILLWYRWAVSTGSNYNYTCLTYDYSFGRIHLCNQLSRCNNLSRQILLNITSTNSQYKVFLYTVSYTRNYIGTQSRTLQSIYLTHITHPVQNVTSDATQWTHSYARTHRAATHMQSWPIPRAHAKHTHITWSTCDGCADIEHVHRSLTRRAGPVVVHRQSTHTSRKPSRQPWRWS